MSTAKQFNRIVEFNSTQPIIGNSGGAVYIAGGLNVSNLNVSNNVTIANLTITNNLFTSTGSTLLSSQWVNVAAGIAFTSGNVGIGTTTPGFTLDVSGGARITGGLTTGTLNIVSGASIPNLLSSVITTSSLLATNFINSTNITSTNLVASFTSLGNLTSLTGTFANKVGGSQTVGTILVTTSASLIGNTNTIGNIFTTGGNVGINTTSPGVTFDVIGTGRFTNLTSTTNSIGTLNNTNLISTNSSISSLNVVNLLSTNNTITNLISTSGTFANTIVGSQTVGTIVVNLSSSLIGNTNTIGNLFTTGGNVGINTTSPGVTFDVIGSGRFTNLFASFTSLGNLTSSTGTFANKVGGSQTVGTLVITTSASLIGNTNTIGNLFTTGGNVGINTTSPVFTLDVSGTTRITNSLTTGNVYSTNTTTTNLVSTTSTIPNLNTANITTTSLITTNLISNLITVNSLLVTTNISTANVFSTNITTTSLISTGISSSSLNSTNTTTTNLVSTTSTIPNLNTTNLISNLITVNSLLATTNISTSNVFSTNITTVNLVSSFTSLGNLTSLTGTFANKVGGSQTVGTILVTTSASLIGNTNTIGNLFTTGGNIGINTTSPQFTLDVNGSGRFNNELIVAGSSNISTQGIHLQWNRSVGGGEARIINQPGGGNNNSIYLSTSSQTNVVTDLWQFSNNNIYNNVGGNIFIDSTVSGSQFIYGFNTPKNAGGSNILQVYNNSTDRNLVFQVQSKGTTTGSDNVIITNNSTLGNILNCIGFNVGNSGTQDASRQSMINMFRNGTSTVQNGVSAELDLGSNTATLNGISTLDFKLASFPATINNFGRLPDNVVMSLVGNGNVGINATNPIYPLHVTGNIYVGPTTFTTAGVGTINTIGLYTKGVFNSNVNGFPATTGTTGNAIALRVRGGDDACMDFGANSSFGGWIQNYNWANGYNFNYPLLLNPNGGNVGINTTSPAYTLDVAGTGRILNNSIQGIVLGNFSGINAFSTLIVSSRGSFEIGIANALGAFSSSANSGDVILRTNLTNLMLQTNPNGSGIYISTGGNVGINTSSPAYPLHVTGNIYAGPTTFTTAVGAGGSINTIGLYTKGVFNSNVNGFPATTGTTGNSIALRVRGGDDAVIDFGVNSGNGGWIQITNFTGYNSNYPLLLNPNGGNVGINTTSPAYTLDVNGSFKSNGASVLQANNIGVVIVQNTLLNYNTGPWTVNNAGLQIGWNNLGGSGGVDFLANEQGGGGPAFNFWYINNNNTTPSRIAQLNNAGQFATVSDYRLKDNVVNLQDDNNFHKLRPVKYIYNRDNSEQIGFIAHEVQEIYPSLVSGKKDDKDYQTLNYTGLLPLVIMEINKLRKIIVQNEEKLKENEERFCNQQKQIDYLLSKLLMGQDLM